MWNPMSQTFRVEATDYKLAFNCEDCAHFCHEREACAIFYPTTEHRKAHVDALADGEPVRFCKMFEAF